MKARLLKFVKRKTAFWVSLFLGLVSFGLISIRPALASPLAQNAPPTPSSGETVYFWRIADGGSGIYIARGQEPPEAFAPINRSGCVGCHVVSSRAGLIAAVLDGANGQIIVNDLQTGADVPIPFAYGSYLAWAPDGNSLAVSYNDSDIYIISLEDQTLTALSGASDPAIIETMPAWSQDGKTIAFIRSSNASNGFMLDADSEIVFVPTAGGVDIVPSGVPGGLNYYPAFSPDGRWLAFTHHDTPGEDSYSSNSADIYLLPLAGGAAIRLNANSDASDSWPSWSADGQWLAFNSNRTGQFDIYLTQIGADGQSGEVFAMPGTNSEAYEHLPAWGLPPEITATPLAPTSAPTRTPPPTPSATPLQELAFAPTLPPTAAPLPTTMLTATPITGIGPLDICLGPLSLPCSTMSLPWWVCLFLLLLLLPLVILLWNWQRQTRERNKPAPKPPEGFPVAPAENFPPFSPSPSPPLLGATALTGRRTAPALILGLGQAGLDALSVIAATLREAYGNIPETVRLLVVWQEEIPTMPLGVESLPIPLDEEVNALASRLRVPGDDLPHLRRWFGAPPDEKAPDRALARLALWPCLKETGTRLSTELRRLSEYQDKNVSLYLIVAPGEAPSALLADLAHLTRQQAQMHKIKLSTFATLILPDAALSTDIEIRAATQRSAFAAWRELDRFQFGFDHPYPFLDGVGVDMKTSSKLFERVYLLSPDRHEKPLGGLPLEYGLYPSLADALLCWLDPQGQRAWNEISRAVDARLNQKQHTLNESLYHSLGTFAYVLPMERMVEEAALRLADGLLAAQEAPLAAEMRDAALECLAQTQLSPDIPNTPLIRDLAQRARSGETVLPIASIGFKVAELLATDRTHSTTETALSSLYTLVNDFLVKKVRTSRDYKAERYDGNYGPDTQRFLREVEDVSSQLDSIDPWLKDNTQRQLQIFKVLFREQILLGGGRVGESRFFARLVEGQIAGMVDQVEVKSAGRVVAFTDAMLDIITVQRAEIDQTAERLERCAEESFAAAQREEENLQARAVDNKEKLPSLGRALLQGFGSVAASDLILGKLSDVFPAFSWFWIPQFILTVCGPAWSFVSLYKRQSLIEAQKSCRAAKQEKLKANAEARLYRTWSEVLRNFENELREVSAPFRIWVHVAEQLRQTLLSRLTSSKNQALEAQQIATRRYLDDQKLADTLYRKHLGDERAAHTAARLIWAPDDTSRWTLKIIGTQVHPIPLAQENLPTAQTLATSETALLDLCRWYASPLRGMTATQALDQILGPQFVSQECERNSTPLIRTLPHEQTETESHRLLFVRQEDQTPYYETVLAGLQATAAQQFSQQLAAYSDRYRVVILSSLDLLRRQGLHSWLSLQGAYLDLPAPLRSSLHIFPAERNAAGLEAHFGEIREPLRRLSPATCLLLEDERRARAFWLAYALGFTQMHEAKDGLGSRRAYALYLPGREPEALTDAQDAQPSLWEAAAAFGLGERGGTVEALEDALKLTSNDALVVRQREDALEKAIEQLARPMKGTPNAELGLLMHLFLDDELRRISDIEPIL